MRHPGDADDNLATHAPGDSDAAVAWSSPAAQLESGSLSLGCQASSVLVVCVSGSYDDGVPALSIVIPHWPLDEETNQALRQCVASFPPRCERIVVVNDGTGYGHNVNIGLGLASGDYIAVVNNDCRLAEGDVYELCVPDVAFY